VLEENGWRSQSLVNALATVLLQEALDYQVVLLHDTRTQVRLHSRPAWPATSRTCVWHALLSPLVLYLHARLHGSTTPCAATSCFPTRQSSLSLSLRTLTRRRRTATAERGAAREPVGFARDARVLGVWQGSGAQQRGGIQARHAWCRGLPGRGGLVRHGHVPCRQLIHLVRLPQEEL
jgi:hypothetical protein